MRQVPINNLLVILKVLRVFWSFFGFVGILVIGEAWFFILGSFQWFLRILDILEVSSLFWSSQKFQEYFGYFRCLRFFFCHSSGFWIFWLINRFWGYFGLFRGLLGFFVILELSMGILVAFETSGHFVSFQEFSWYFWSFQRFSGVFWSFQRFWVFLVIWNVFQ